MLYLGDQFVSKTNYGAIIKQIFITKFKKSYLILKPFQNHDFFFTTFLQLNKLTKINNFKDCLISMNNRIFDASPDSDIEAQSHELFNFTSISLKTIDQPQ
jgi:hypothetical protein